MNWLAVLKQEAAASSIASVASKLGYHRSAISQIINGCGHYGSGKANTRRIEEKVLRVFCQRPCPHLQSEISANECRDFALRRAPTHNPMQLAHWRACQGCAHRPVMTDQTSPVKDQVKEMP